MKELEMNSYKSKIKYLPLVFVFCYYVWIFYTIPLQRDRYLEPVSVGQLRNSWRAVVTQYYWVRKCNLRVLSNLFSMMVDPNTIIGAIVNAVMLLGIIILLVLTIEDESKKAIAISLSCVMTILLGEEIQSEVYLYAKTLYISSTLLLLLFIKWYMDEKNIHEHYRRMVILILVSTLWFEITVAGICVACWMGLLMAIIEKKYEKAQLRLTVLSTICTIGSFLWILYIAPHRTSNMGVKHIGRFPNILQQNVWIMILWLVGLTAYYIKKNKTITILISAIIFVYLFGMAFLKLYAVIKEPIDVPNPYSWTHRSFYYLDTMEQFFKESLYRTAYLVILLFFLLSVVYAFIEKNILDLILVAVSFVELFIANVLLNGEGRISYVGVVMLSVLIVRMICQNMTSNFRLYSTLATIIMVVAVIRFWNLGIFVSLQHEVAMKRNIIANKVREEQLCNTWNYNQEVVFPGYIKNVNELTFNLDEESRFIGTDQYDTLLSAYGLNERTKLVIEE